MALRVGPSCLFLLLGSTALAQLSVPVFRSEGRLVVLSATAVDRRSRPVTNLRADEFRVYDEGRLQILSRFSRGRDLAARVLLLMDASGSMSGELRSASARMAALQILAALQPADEVALASFDDSYREIQPFTADKARVLAGLEAIRPYGSTAIHDSLERAARELARRGEGRRAVILITDGIDTSSRRTADDVIARSRALDVPIYTVSVVSPLDDPASSEFSGRDRATAAAAGQKALARYAEMSGGAAFTVSDFRGLKGAADRIAAELSCQYRLGYDPPEGPPRFRQVEIRSTRPGVSIRTRRGYLPQS